MSLTLGSNKTTDGMYSAGISGSLALIIEFNGPPYSVESTLFKYVPSDGMKMPLSCSEKVVSIGHSAGRDPKSSKLAGSIEM